MPECRVIPYFKGFLAELKEILSMGGTCTGSMLGDLNDFLRANTSTTTPPTTAASTNYNNNINSTTGNAPNSNNNPNPPTAFQNSSLTMGTLDPVTAPDSATNNSGIGFTSSNNNACGNNISQAKNVLRHSEANCMKQQQPQQSNNNSSSNNVGPSKGCQSGTHQSTDLGVMDSITRGMQTVNVASAMRSPQDQRRELGSGTGGGNPPKNSQQKVVSSLVRRGFAWTFPRVTCYLYLFNNLRRFRRTVDGSIYVALQNCFWGQTLSAEFFFVQKLSFSNHHTHLVHPLYLLRSNHWYKKSEHGKVWVTRNLNELKAYVKSSQRTLLWHLTVGGAFFCCTHDLFYAIPLLSDGWNGTRTGFGMNPWMNKVMANGPLKPMSLPFAKQTFPSWSGAWLRCDSAP